MTKTLFRLLLPIRLSRSKSATSTRRRKCSWPRIEILEQRRLLAATILDSGFENPVQPVNDWEQANGTGGGSLVGSPWTITSGAGITRNFSAFQNGGIPAPEGVQHALIQNNGSFRQTVTGFEVGAEYEFSLLTMARQSGNGGNDLEVKLDAGLGTEIVLVDIPEVTFTSFTNVTSPTFVATKTSYTLTIDADRNGGTLAGGRTTMFDDVRFRLIPNLTESVQTGDWTDPNTWDNGIPDATSRAIVSSGTTVTLDGTDHVADEVVVHGVLDVAEDANPNPKTLTADWIHVNSGGVFQIGTQADRFDTNQFVLTLTGVDPEADHVIERATGTMAVNNNNGFLMTHSGGRLQFFGEEKLTFTKLAATALAGSGTITANNVIERNFDGTTSAASDGQLNWEIGDEIVIASSSYDYAEEEVRTITAVNNTGTETVLTLDAPLNFRHYGEIESYGNGTRTWDIDMRAEVALLNRSITIQGTQDTDNSFGDRGQYGTGAGQNVGIGAHTMVMPGSGQITVDAVRFDKMGQTGRLGRYPMHWHVAGNRAGDVLRNSSVTNSNNRGVTIHGTQGVRLEGNVLHDIHGHGIFMEDAAESDNEFLHNITFGIHKVGGGFTSNDPFVVPGITRGPDGKVNGEAPRSENGESSHDTGQQAAARFVHSAAYWITNPDNTWVGNISAGSEGTGFWFALPTTVLGLSKDTGLYNGINPLQTNLLQFDNNTAHSSQVGLTFDRGEDIMEGTSSNNFSPPQTMQINNLTAYKNHGTAVYHRASFGIFNESRFADNAFGSFNTFNQEERNILFVGHSRGNAEPATLVGGYRLYDGPGRIVDSHFAGFAADNAHAFRIEGGANKFSHTRAQGISFEDDGTAEHLGIELYGDNFISVNESPTFVAGRPDSISGLVYDVDGSLTTHGGGGAGHVLTPKVDFYRDSTDIAPAGWNGFISDDRFAQFRIGRIADVAGDYIPPFRISNGDGHSIVADRWNLTYWQRMYVKVNAGDYTVEFLSGIPADGFDVLLQVRQVEQPADATVFRFVDAARDYKPNQGTEVTSVDALRVASGTSWYRAVDGDLWMKIFESETTIKIEATTPLVVSNTNDSGAGSLRSAINTANSSPGLDTITFDIGSAGSTHTIQPQSPLPTITDRVIIDGRTQAPKPVTDGGFENPVQPANTWELANGNGNGNLAGSQWTITGSAGITRNNSAFQRSNSGVNTGFVPAPEGIQHALIQSTGSFTQTVAGFEVGRRYELSLLTMARQSGSLGNDLEVKLDAGLGTELVLIDIPEVTFTRFTEVTSPTFLATKSSYSVTIDADRNGGALSGNRTTHFDDVQFRSINPITIDGSQAGVANGLNTTVATGVSVLTVNGFANGAGIQLGGTGGSMVDRVWSGVDSTGTSSVQNRYGIRIVSDGNTVRNSLLSGNERAGVRVLTAADNVITNNWIGTDAAGTGALGNGQDGVELRSSTGVLVTGNVIAHNGNDGVLVVVNDSVDNTISANSIFSNGQRGIDLGNGGVTLNDNLDADTGANDLTNFPVVLEALPTGATTTVIGDMNGLANTEYTIEFFSNDQLDTTGYGEGQNYLGTTTVTTDGSGTATFNAVIAVAVPTGQFITTTATDPSGDTSEFSLGVDVSENDFGDAPTTYPTLVADNGARHVPTGPRLGATRDVEGDGQPNASANGDGADEDGAMFGSIGLNAAMAAVNIDLQNATSAFVHAWIDFDGNGKWESAEQILTSAPVTAGLQTMNFIVPTTGVVAGDTFARVRVSSAGGLQPTGAADDGEVEDYQVTIFPAVPQVETVTINGGDASRSKVTSLTVQFDSEVDHAALDTAFAITNITNDTRVDTVNVAATDSGGKTTAVLTFAGASTLAPQPAQVGTLGTTLVDGNYRLDVLAGGVQLATNNAATMPIDYVFGGQLNAAPDNDNFFRWYGDNNGDGYTDFDDFAGGFLPAFGSENGVGMNYNEGLDANGDGFVDFSDFASGFLPKFGSERP